MDNFSMNISNDVSKLKYERRDVTNKQTILISINGNTVVLIIALKSKRRRRILGKFTNIPRIATSNSITIIGNVNNISAEIKFLSPMDVLRA
jgi:tricorn protease-like protein